MGARPDRNGHGGAEGSDPEDARLDDLDRPEFGKLVEGSGRKDRDRVDHFCAGVLESHPSGTPSDDLDDLDDPDDPDDPDGASYGAPDSDDFPSGDSPTRPSAKRGAGTSLETSPRSGSIPSDLPVSPPQDW